MVIQHSLQGLIQIHVLVIRIETMKQYKDRGSQAWCRLLCHRAYVLRERLHRRVGLEIDGGRMSIHDHLKAREIILVFHMAIIVGRHFWFVPTFIDLVYP